MKILIAGDLCPVGRLANYSPGSDITSFVDDKILQKIKTVDFSIVNLECPIAGANDIPILKDGPNIGCKEDNYSIIKDLGFDGVTLANNHFRDYGDTSIINSINLLDSFHLYRVGGGRSITEASKILYVKKDNQILAIINCCEQESSIADKYHAGANPNEPIHIYYQIIEARQHSDYVIIITHGGHEHYQLPSPRMQKMYRFFIDSGADAVINHHQHCYSGYEIYSEKPIFYGLGNFMFDTIHVKKKKSWHEGYVVELNLTDTIDFELIPYSQANNDLFVRHMEGEDLHNFNNCIDVLNAIITNPNKLENSFVEYCKHNFLESSFYVTPYFGRIPYGLFIRRLIPAIYPRRKLIELNNRINCESYLDLMRYSFKSLIKRYE